MKKIALSLLSLMAVVALPGCWCSKEETTEKKTEPAAQTIPSDMKEVPAEQQQMPEMPAETAPAESETVPVK